MSVPARQRIIELYQQGKSTRDIGEFFGSCAAAVRRERQQFKDRGTLEPQTHLCGRKTLLTAGRKARLQKLVDTQSDATLAKVGYAQGPPVWDFDDGSVAAQAGFDLKRHCTPPNKTDPTWPQKERMGMSNSLGLYGPVGVCGGARSQYQNDPLARTSSQRSMVGRWDSTRRLSDQHPHLGGALERALRSVSL
jgi:transposase